MDSRGEPDGYDELSAAESSRTRWVAGAVALVLAAAGITIARAGHSSSPKHRAPPPPISAPAPVAARHPVHLGSVFLEHLPQCTVTDHRHNLSVAVAVTNLGDRSLQLVGASGLTSDTFVVRPTTVSVGSPPCGRPPVGHLVHVASGDVVVVRLQFYVADKCPDDALVSARIAFDGGRRGIIHADSSQLADLSQLTFVQCG
jgi:hypothetical protein